MWYSYYQNKPINLLLNLIPNTIYIFIPTCQRLDLSIRTNGLNMGWVYLDSDKIRVRYISSLSKIWTGVFWFHEFQVDLMCLERLLCKLFFFCENKKPYYIYYSKLLAFNEKNIMVVIFLNNIASIQTFHCDM